MPARPPPRDRADVQCINCNRKGHTAQDCRQPRVEKDKRKCFLCDQPGHVARDCKERRPPIKAFEHARVGSRSDPAFLGRVQIADTDDFIPVKRGLRQQEPHFGDFIRATPRMSFASSRYRELTVVDLLKIDDEITSRGGGHPLLMRQVEPKLEVSSLSDFPALSSSGQREIGCMPALPSLPPLAQTKTVNFVVASMSDFLLFHWSFH